MADYAALPAWQVLAICEARSIDVHSAQTTDKCIEMLHKSDREQRQDDLALDAKLDNFNNWSDPTCVERLLLGQEILDIKVQRLQTETENLITHTKEMKGNTVHDYTSFANSIEEDMENKVGDLQREWNEREAYLLSRASALETQRLEHERIEEEYRKFYETKMKFKLKFDRRRQVLEDQEQAFEEHLEQSTEESAEDIKDRLKLQRTRRRLLTDENNALDRFDQQSKALLEQAGQNKDLDNVQRAIKKLQQAPYRGRNRNSMKVVNLSRAQVLERRRMENEQHTTGEILSELDGPPIPHSGPEERQGREAAKELQEKGATDQNETANEENPVGRPHRRNGTFTVARTLEEQDPVPQTTSQVTPRAGAHRIASQITPQATAPQITSRTTPRAAAHRIAAPQTTPRMTPHATIRQLTPQTIRQNTPQSTVSQSTPRAAAPQVETLKGLKEAAGRKAAQEIEQEKQKPMQPARKTGMTMEAARKEVEEGCAQFERQLREMGIRKGQAFPFVGSRQQVAKQFNMHKLVPSEVIQRQTAKVPKDKAARVVIDLTIDGPENDGASAAHKDATANNSAAKTAKKPSHQKVSPAKYQKEPAGRMQHEDAHDLEPSKKAKRVANRHTAQRTPEDRQDDFSLTNLKDSSDVTQPDIECPQGPARQKKKSTSQKPKVVEEMAPVPKTEGGFVLEDRIAEISAQRGSAMAEGIPPQKTAYQIAFDRRVEDYTASKDFSPKTVDQIAFDRLIEDAITRKMKEAEDRLTGQRPKSPHVCQAQLIFRVGLLTSESSSPKMILPLPQSALPFPTLSRIPSMTRTSLPLAVPICQTRRYAIFLELLCIAPY